MIKTLQPVISTTGIRRILDNEGREIATVSNLLDGKESEYIHNEICNRFNSHASPLATLKATILWLDGQEHLYGLAESGKEKYRKMIADARAAIAQAEK